MVLTHTIVYLYTKTCASAALKSMCLQQNYTLYKSIKSAGAGEGRQQCRATGEGGSCYRAAAGGGSRRRLIRKYEPTSAVALATPAARRMKIKQKKFFLCRVFFFLKKCFPVIESGVGLWVMGIITLHAVSQGRRQHCVVWIRMMVIKSGMK